MKRYVSPWTLKNEGGAGEADLISLYTVHKQHTVILPNVKTELPTVGGCAGQ